MKIPIHTNIIKYIYIYIHIHTFIYIYIYWCSFWCSSWPGPPRHGKTWRCPWFWKALCMVLLDWRYPHTGVFEHLAFVNLLVYHGLSWFIIWSIPNHPYWNLHVRWIYHHFTSFSDSCMAHCPYVRLCGQCLVRKRQARKKVLAVRKKEEACADLSSRGFDLTGFWDYREKKRC